MKTEIKNIAKGALEEVNIEDGFFVLKVKNESSENKHFTRKIDNSYIQFHFCVKGGAKFNFNEGKYNVDVLDEHSLLLYNPQRDLPIDFELQANSWLVSILISIKKFHSLFSTEANYIDFLTDDNKDKKYYDTRSMSPSVAVVLNQILNYNLHPSIKALYLKGKAFELLSLYFNKTPDANIEQCPFLVDEKNVLKLKMAKDIIISRMAEPPSLHELANEIDLSLKKLKAGFKEIYGDTVFGFLLEYKLDYSRKLLEEGKHNVNEVGLKVGYSTASHFIAAFKKKFGTTPKKYISNSTN